MAKQTDNKHPKVEVIFDPEPVRLRTTVTDKHGKPKLANRGEFAALIGISQNGYTDLTRNPSGVRNTTIAGIISATGCSINDLYRIVAQN